MYISPRNQCCLAVIWVLLLVSRLAEFRVNRILQMMLIVDLEVLKVEFETHLLLSSIVKVQITNASHFVLIIVLNW